MTGVGAERILAGITWFSEGKEGFSRRRSIKGEYRKLTYNEGGS